MIKILRLKYKESLLALATFIVYFMLFEIFTYTIPYFLARMSCNSLKGFKDVSWHLLLLNVQVVFQLA